MAGRQYQQVAYGLTSALIAENPTPVIAKRNPTASDFAIPTTIWTNTTLNAVYILASISNNTANWVLVEAGGGAGAFGSLTVTPGPISLTGTTTINTAGAANTTIGTGGTGAVNIGNATGNTVVTGTLAVTSDITSDTGNIVALLGNIDAAAGSITADTNLVATTGNITALAGSIGANTTVTAGTGMSTATGNITATAGSVNAGTTMTAGTGITATTGNIVATAGQVNAGTTMTAGTGITATTGNITASAGNVVATGAASGFVFGTSTIKIISGAGAPAAVVPKGSLYLRTDGSGVNDRAYIATDGAGTWTAIVTVG